MSNIQKRVAKYIKSKKTSYHIAFIQAEDYLRYKIGKIIDPMPKGRKKETMDEYMKRIKVSQAIRWTKYEYIKATIANASYRAQRPDTSMYSSKDAKLLESIIDTLFDMEDNWKRHYFRACERKRIEEERD